MAGGESGDDFGRVADVGGEAGTDHATIPPVTRMDLGGKKNGSSSCWVFDSCHWSLAREVQRCGRGS